MDTDEKIAVFFLSFMIALIVLFCISLVMDGMSANDCRFAGYDGGDQIFWQARTICYNEITPYQEAVKEYFYLEK